MRAASRLLWKVWVPALSVLTLSLAACNQPKVAAVPMMTQVSTWAPAPTMVVHSTPPPPVPLDDQGFAARAFRALWERSDRAVGNGSADRSWLWGTPVPSGARFEAYAEASGGKRLVEYFDKGRMEINDPKANPNSQWYVTSGLLTTELVTGRMQTGDASYETVEPAQVPVAGDLESISPVTPRYADFGSNRLTRSPNRSGGLVDTLFQRGKSDIQISPPAPVKIAAYDETSGHNVPDVFTNYFDRDLSALGQNWLFVMGHPISEPYWITARFNGDEQIVLVQLFERRALTFNPRNKVGWQVEFANIGLHYYRWRYHNR